jgi:hypothetical protein
MNHHLDKWQDLYKHSRACAKLLHAEGNVSFGLLLWQTSMKALRTLFVDFRP